MAAGASGSPVPQPLCTDVPNSTGVFISNICYNTVNFYNTQADAMAQCWLKLSGTKLTWQIFLEMVKGTFSLTRYTASVTQSQVQSDWSAGLGGP